MRTSTNSSRESKPTPRCRPRRPHWLRPRSKFNSYTPTSAVLPHPQSDFKSHASLAQEELTDLTHSPPLRHCGRPPAVCVCPSLVLRIYIIYIQYIPFYSQTIHLTRVVEFTGERNENIGCTVKHFSNGTSFAYHIHYIVHFEEKECLPQGPAWSIRR